MKLWHLFAVLTVIGAVGCVVSASDVSVTLTFYAALASVFVYFLETQ